MSKQNKPSGRWLTRTWLQSRRHGRGYTVPTVMHYCLPIGQFVKN